MKDLNQIANMTLDTLAAAGADMAQCTVASSETREFNVDGGQFSLFRTLFDNSLRMNGWTGGRKGAGAINRFDEQSVREAAEACMAAAASSEPDSAWEVADGGAAEPVIQGCPDADMDKFFARLREFMDELGKRHPKIMMEQLIASHKRVRRVYANSRGTRFETLSGCYSIGLMYSAHEGDATSSFFSTDVTVESLDLPIMEMSCVDKDLSDIEAQIYPQPLEGKFEGVAVLAPSSFAEFISGVLGNFVIDGPMIMGTSLWKDKLGQRVASDSITIGMCPADPRVVCGDVFTAEGYACRDYQVIRGGVLESFMLSQYAANKTGNARALNDTYSMVMQPGDKPLGDIIASIDRGILVGRLSGGRPSASGEASYVAKNSFLIEHGKITGAVSEAMINGNLADMLMNVRAVSAETVADGSSVIPWVAFDSVTISGK